MAIPNSETPQTPNPNDDAKLDQSLHGLETFLRLFGFCQYSFLSFSLSWLAFLLVVALLVVSLKSLIVPVGKSIRSKSLSFRF
ncbi:hypothetical protein L3X38_028958 [Prunus dulcis]|uniref:Uncharacterized protein n=1 Tax=Prunus dulcis TaxID=3755 RepID=A0AAD4VRQ2_PRUDU|nr:hypothetical protein L3X38_028958 [Prunus dulcis]